MREANKTNLLQRNPATQDAHRRQVFWQITLPFTLGALVILALAISTVVAGIGDREIVSRWGDISLIWLILPMFVVTLLFLLLTAVLIYAVIKLIGVFPAFAFRVQEFMTSLRTMIRSISDKAAEPMINAHSFLAAVRKLAGR